MNLIIYESKGIHAMITTIPSPIKPDHGKVYIRCKYWNRHKSLESKKGRIHLGLTAQVYWRPLASVPEGLRPSVIGIEVNIHNTGATKRLSPKNDTFEIGKPNFRAGLWGRIEVSI